MLAVLLLLASLAQSNAPRLQPRTYSSPSGEWTCHVDPSSIHGSGPSQVVVERAGTRAWSCELAYTLKEVCITDSGHCAGYGCTSGWSIAFAEGDFVIALFDPEGGVLREERVARTSSRFLHMRHDPAPLGIFAHPELDRTVVRIDDEDVNRQDEVWWRFRTSTGEKLEPVRPKEKLEDRECLRRSMDVRPVAGTPLTLVQWYVFGDRPGGTRDLGTSYMLVDADHEPVWTLALPKDFRLADRDAELLASSERRSKSGILAVSPKRFELLCVARNERIAFEVSESAAAPSGWRVRELERVQHVELRTQPADLATLELHKVASTAFKHGASSGAPVLAEVEGVLFDGRGHVVLQDRLSSALHLFSSTGQRVGVLASELGEVGWDLIALGSIASAPDGRMYLSTDPLFDRHVALAASGELLGQVELGGQRVAFLASGERWAARWAVQEIEMVRKLSADGEERAQITRRPDGQFFVDIAAIGCRPSGELAVLSGGEGLELDLFDATGAPQRNIALHGAPRDWWKSIDYRDDLVLVSTWSDAAIVVALPSGRPALVRVTEGAPSSTKAFTLSPDGRELWCATQAPPALHRFALPE